MPVTDAPKRDILSDNNPPPHPMSKHLSLFNEYILSVFLYFDTTLLIYRILISVNLCKD